MKTVIVGGVAGGAGAAARLPGVCRDFPPNSHASGLAAAAGFCRWRSRIPGSDLHNMNITHFT